MAPKLLKHEYLLSSILWSDFEHFWMSGSIICRELFLSLTRCFQCRFFFAVGNFSPCQLPSSLPLVLCSTFVALHNTLFGISLNCIKYLDRSTYQRISCMIAKLHISKNIKYLQTHLQIFTLQAA